MLKIKIMNSKQFEENQNVVEIQAISLEKNQKRQIQKYALLDITVSLGLFVLILSWSFN